MDYMKLYKEWIEASYIDDETKDELRAIESNEKEIEDRFYRDLEFGTAGLRGILGAGTNRMNLYTVRKTTYGLVKYLMDNFEDAADRGIVIAHDNRKMSREFCMESVRVISGMGMKVYYFDDLRTTPMLSYSVRRLNCIGGIVITASHNPSNYNGYKVYGDNGAQIMPDVAKKVLETIDRDSSLDVLPLLDEKANKDKAVMLDSSLDDEFIEAVERNSIRKDIIKKYAKDFKVVYTPLCGTGRVPVIRVLRDCGFENIIVVPEEEMPDKNFAGIDKPNPEEKEALERGIALMVREEADILIANDPDCDRVGIAVRGKDSEPILISGNQIGGLLTDYVLKGLKETNRLTDKACMIKTIVTSEFGADIARDMGVEVVEILTGFKFLGEKMTQYEKDGSKDFTIGYEESYGYLVGDQCRDKDGVVATLMIAEMALYYRSKGKSIYDALIDLYQENGYYRENTNSIYLGGKEGSAKIKEIMDTMRGQSLSQINGSKVVRLDDFKKGVEGFPISDVLKYYLDDGSWIALRPSGTEPKIKIYIGTHDKSDSVARRRLEELTQSFDEMIKSI